MWFQTACICLAPHCLQSRRRRVHSQTVGLKIAIFFLGGCTVDRQKNALITTTSTMNATLISCVPSKTDRTPLTHTHRPTKPYTRQKVSRQNREQNPRSTAPARLDAVRQTPVFAPPEMMAQRRYARGKHDAHPESYPDSMREEVLVILCRYRGHE